MKRTFVVLLLFLLSGAKAQSAPIGIAIQNSHYDKTKLGSELSIDLFNTTHKDITAFVISTKDGQTEVDLLPLIISVNEAAANGNELYANGQRVLNGAFLPGEVRTQTVSSSSPDATVTVVAYADGTAQATDQQAFADLMEHRQGRLLALQKVNEVIEKSLSDPTVKDHHSAIQAELKQLALTYKNQNDSLLLYEGMHLETSVIPLNDADLPAFVESRQKRIALLSPHTKLAVQP